MSYISVYIYGIIESFVYIVLTLINTKINYNTNINVLSSII